MILSTIPHFFIGLPEIVLKPVAEGKITDPDTAKSFYAIWIFASITMFMTGMTLVIISTELKRLNKSAWRVALLLSAGIGSFGLSMMIKMPEAAAHMSLFLIIGLITLLPVLFFFRDYTGTQAS